MKDALYSPVRKGIETPVVVRVNQGQAIEDVYDTQDVAAGASSVAFFAAQPGSNRIDANYQSNPLPGSYSRKVLALSLNSTKGVIQHADAVEILNALRHANLEITADTNENLLLRIPVRGIMNLEDAKVEHSVDAAGTGDIFTLTLPATAAQPLANPFQIGDGQVFQATVKFKDGSSLPADTFGLQLTMIAVRG